jgi:uncharacterized protein (TIGR03083 family)
MDRDTYLDVIRGEGRLFLEAAKRAGLGAVVPTCPEWKVADLVHHVGVVHRKAGTYVREGRPTPLLGDELDAVVGPRPPDEGLFDYFREGFAALLDALAGAPSDLECWTFFAAPSPLDFWMRRQAHELAIHRADAQSPDVAGSPGVPDGYDAAFAADGVDELLCGFFGDPQRSQGFEVTGSVQVTAGDVDGRWHLAIEPGRMVATREERPADLAVTGPASDLYLFLWNRTSPDAIEVTGDRRLLHAWRNTARIRSR